jgi:hypothetical protein
MLRERVFLHSQLTKYRQQNALQLSLHSLRSRERRKSRGTRAKKAVPHEHDNKCRGGWGMSRIARISSSSDPKHGTPHGAPETPRQPSETPDGGGPRRLLTAQRPAAHNCLARAPVTARRPAWLRARRAPQSLTACTASGGEVWGRLPG